MTVILQGVLWAVFGTIIYRERIVGRNLPRLLGRSLYWLGVPLQIFVLARKSNFDSITGLPALMTVVMLLLGLAIALLAAQIMKQLIFAVVSKLTPQNDLEGLLLSVGLLAPPPAANIIEKVSPKSDRSTGSFVLASILGNTGFIGLALVPSLVDSDYWGWIALYGVAHNVLGSYGLGVLVADYYGRSGSRGNVSNQLQKLLFLPSLWAFAYGYFGNDIVLPAWIEKIIAGGILLVIPGAFILIGMQLSRLGQWKNLASGAIPAILKILIIPALAGFLLTCFGVEGDARLVLVLMSGMPTAFASIILVEEYDLDRQIAASSILLSTIALPIMVSIWLKIF